jgi:hypothetical protein
MSLFITWPDYVPSIAKIGITALCVASSFLLTLLGKGKLPHELSTSWYRVIMCLAVLVIAGYVFKYMNSNPSDFGTNELWALSLATWVLAAVFTGLATTKVKTSSEPREVNN